MAMSLPVEKATEFIKLYNTESILEVGCGKGGILAQFNAPVRIGIDYFRPFLDEAKKIYQGIIFVQHDVTALSICFLAGSFDAVIGFDILEHLPENDMYALIQTCEDLAKKLVIFFSPLDEAGLMMHPEPVEGNPGMKHVTIIKERYFTERGYLTFKYPDYHGNGVTALLAIKEM